MPSPKRERQRHNKAAGRPVCIAVCAYPSPTISPVVELLKSAVLYGDKVVLHSPVGSILGQLAAIADGDEDQFRSFVTAVGSNTNAEFSAQIAELDEQFGPGQGLRMVDQLINPRSLLRTQLARDGQLGELDLVSLERTMADAKRDFEDVTQAQLRDAGFEEVRAAFDAQVLSVGAFDLGDDLEQGFLRSLDDVLSDTSIYPLFDDDLADFVRTATAKGRVKQTERTAARGTQAATADRLLASLPTFPAATMDEIVGIRDELRKPLVRFRSEMISVTADLQLDALADDFDEAVVELWHERVAPCLDELDEVTRQGGLLRSFGPAALTKVPVPATVFAVGALSGNPAAGGAGALATAAFQVAEEARAARKERKQRRAANPYFFLHQVNRSLDAKS